ncbi:hypothetical protein MKW92_002203 [Papaver armeniacum]|nr:hypothetical protein MKW92_002203 [Papaver armeniacum]
MENLSRWDGTISSSEFRIAATTLSEKWKVINSDNVDNKICVDSQAHRNSIDTLCGYKSSCQKEELLNFWNEEEPVDSATLVLNDDDQKELHYYDFHIVYNNSYMVPVLYSRGYRSGNDLPAYSLKVLSELKWTFITQEEHPLLNLPWYTLHPCGTSEWMKLLFLGGHSQAKDGSSSYFVMQQYLVSWLSVVGQKSGCWFKCST